MEKMSIKEIAKKLGLPITTVKSRIRYRSIKPVRYTMSPQGGGFCDLYRRYYYTFTSCEHTLNT